MSKSPWGNIGAWAAEAERAEEEERQAAEKAAAAAAAPQPEPEPSFPSLKEALSSSNKQKKKKKMTLQEFTMQQPSLSISRGLTPEEMLRLPRGPSERSPDGMHYGRLGGGFSSYGTRPGSGGSNQTRSREYGLQDEGRRGGPRPSRVSEFNQPSRADEVDNWASMKKNSLPEYYSSQPRPGERYSSLGGPGATSRADEVDNWGSGKRAIPQPQQHHRPSSFGSAFSRPERDRWTRDEQSVDLNPPRSGEVESLVKVSRSNPFGAARPREEVLAEKGLDWKKLDLDLDAKQQQQQNSVSGGSRPASSQSSRPDSPLSSRSTRREVPSAVLTPGVGEGEVRQRPKVNPFGDARPREVLLEQKGLDWKKIDLELEHRQVEREETEEEKNLKEELEHLKKELPQKSGDEQSSIHELILQKEQELELLIQKLDDKVRYSQKPLQRLGTGASRSAIFNDRPPSRPGAYEDPRPGYSNRPHSRPGRYENPRTGSLERQPSSRGGAYEEPRADFAERPLSHRGAYEDTHPGSHDGPHSRPGAYEEPRGGFPQRSFTPGAYQEPRVVEYNERPHSRGTVNSWTRHSNNQRTIQGGGGRGFLGSRDMNWSGSRW